MYENTTNQTILILAGKTNMVTYRTTVEALSSLNYWYVEVPPHILEQLPGRTEKGDFNQRLIITLDGKISWQCGILALGEGSGLITVQKNRLKELGKDLYAEVEVSLVKDHSEYGVEVTEVCQIYWDQVPEAKSRFEQLKPSMQRYILNHISQPKSEVKQLERTQELFARLLDRDPKVVTFRYLLGKDN